MSPPSKTIEDFQRLRQKRHAPARSTYRAPVSPTAEWDVGDGTTLLSPSGRKGMVTVDLPVEWTHEITKIATALGLSGPPHEIAGRVLRKLVLDAMRRHGIGDPTRYLRAPERYRLEGDWVHRDAAARSLGVSKQWISRVLNDFNLADYKRDVRYGKGFEIPQELVNAIYSSHEYHRYMQRRGLPVPGGGQPMCSLYDVLSTVPQPASLDTRPPPLFSSEELEKARHRQAQEAEKNATWWKRTLADDGQRSSDYIEAHRPVLEAVNAIIDAVTHDPTLRRQHVIAMRKAGTELCLKGLRVDEPLGTLYGELDGAVAAFDSAGYSPDRLKYYDRLTRLVRFA